MLQITPGCCIWGINSKCTCISYELAGLTLYPPPPPIVDKPT